MDEIRKRLREIHDEVPPDYYDRSMRENLFQRFWHTRRIRAVSEMLSSGQGLLLDIGCAGGTLLERVAKDAGVKDAVGVDASFRAVKYAASMHAWAKYICADFFELPFKDSSFQRGTAIEVLEHLSEPEAALAEMNRCLKTGGMVVVLVPNENNILFRIIWRFWTMGKGRVWKDAHVQRFVEKSLKGLLSLAGFQVVETKKILLGMLLAVKAIKKGF